MSSIEIGFVNQGYLNHSVHALVGSGDPTWPWKALCGQRLDLAALENEQGTVADVDCKRCTKKLAQQG